MFHLGFFSSMAVPSWNGTFSGRDGIDWMKPRYYVDAANALERAGFDAIVFEDSSQVHETYGSSIDYAMRTGMGAPKMDPVPYIPVIARNTSHIGLLPTIATTFYPPFLTARLLNSLDNQTTGRIGANIVTGSTHLAAQNFGLDEQIEHDKRYEMADEWVQVVKELWDSWEHDAVVRDEATGVYADPSKVHVIDHVGEFYRSRGPLNTLPSPQGRPVLSQAGGSPAGRQFGAKHGDLIVSGVPGVDRMKEYRQDMSKRLIEEGRRPEDAKVLFIVAPIIGETMEEALEIKARRDAASEVTMQNNLFWMSYYSGVDFAKFDLDAPMPDVAKQNNGHQSTMADYAAAGTEKTLRELASTYDATASVELVGTADSIASQMGDVMEEVGGDGFLMSGLFNRRSIAEIADGLAPKLRSRGLIRDGFTKTTLRENLAEF